MEDEEDGGDLLAALSLSKRSGSSRLGSTSTPAQTGSQRNKVLPFSQPFPDISGPGFRRGTEEKITISRSSSDNEYNTADDWDDDRGGSQETSVIPSSRYPRSRQSLPCDETFRNQQFRLHLPQLGHQFPQSSHQQFGGSRVSDAPTIPEFVGAGGGQGIFKLPLRAPVHPLRPPSLDLRPHPLRETQAGSFLRTIACTKEQLWAGQESGVRFWNYSEFYLGSEGEGRRLRGDEETSPFRVSILTSPTMCMVVDGAKKLVWTGHKDGRIRSWRMEQPGDQICPASFESCLLSTASSRESFKEVIAWQAHRNPVLSIVITSYGNEHFDHSLHYLFSCSH